MNKGQTVSKNEMEFIKGWRLIASVLVLLAIYASSFYNYLLFHGIAEIISVIIAVTVFFIAWNSREYSKSNYLLFIGVAYLFIGSIDLTHTFAYKGMGVFTGIDANHPTQLWIAARFMESLTLLVAFQFFKKKLNPYFLFLFYFSATSLILISIFYWEIFPDCFIEGSGLTLFKIASEYVISLILMVTIVCFYVCRGQFDNKIFKLLVVSVILTIFAELAFTFYISVYGLSNLIGHILKIISFYLIYRAIVVIGLKKPYNLLFRELSQTEERYRNLVDTIPYGIEEVDIYGRMVYLNESYHKILGYPYGELVNSFIWDHENGRDAKVRLKEYFSYLLTDQPVPEPYFSQKVRKDGEIIDVLVDWNYTRNNKGEIIGIIAVVSDVTKQKQADNQIKASLIEKETLLHEIHHRVKNNMQIIASLLDMQLSRKDEQTVESVIKDSKGRVYAMAAIHDSIHQSDRLSEIDFGAYVQHLSSLLSQTFIANPESISFDIKIPEISPPIEKANPLGLVLNELISNSLKYAFPDDQKGTIEIAAKIKNDDLFELVVSDDGIGMPAGFDWTKSNTMGLRLVKNLVERQLNGSVEYKNQDGTRFVITFNLESDYKS